MTRPVRHLLLSALSALAAPAAAQTPAAPAAQSWPQRIPSSGGEVILPSEGAKRSYDQIKYASSRRVGDTLYVSGVIAGGGRAGGRRGVQGEPATGLPVERNLSAAGAGFADVVMINSFHVWDSPHFKGGRDDHFRAVSEVKDEFMRAPHPAWTAVGTTGLLSDTGLVGIQVIAHVPPKKKR